VDSTARIHFTAVLRYMEIAEHELRRSLGFPQATSFPAIAFPRVHVSCDYRAAIRYDDELEIQARVERIGRSSWTVAFNARLVDNVQKGEPAERPVAAEGTMVMVAIDTKTEKAIPLPEELRAALARED
jgi:YbgC/YbaW family acyl-CoA thioester hydrolase